MCGNFAQNDPTQQSWTAQAEPSSLLAAIKYGLRHGFTISKHDVKGAFLNAKIPAGKIVVVRPPAQWVKWGLVPDDVLWTLDRAVYGLRESPALWSGERDAQLSKLRWKLYNREFLLERCTADSQLWKLQSSGKNDILGMLVVYVDDFLLLAPLGDLRNALLAALNQVWTLTKEETLDGTKPLTFLGIDLTLKNNGDVLLSQEGFVNSILEKHLEKSSKGNKCVQIDKLPDDPDVPSPKDLKALQGFSGEFNWLATRTRPDMSYLTSLLASAITRYCKWSFELARKILRYLIETKGLGILISKSGDLFDLKVWTDAGYAGSSTRSQSGVIIMWGGSIVTWRSSKQTVDALSTCEAELNAAVLGWQIVEGLRLLFTDFGIEIPSVHVLIDNQAALTIAMCGANWRTRYFAVRGHRLHLEHSVGRAKLLHCPTLAMIADTLTKLASPSVIEVLHRAMLGQQKYICVHAYEFRQLVDIVFICESLSFFYA